VVTVSQIAAALAPIVDPPAAAPVAVEGAMAFMEPPDIVALQGTALVERIRHWTRERMLLPAGQLHTGRGKHRYYPADAIYEAALLQTLTTAGLSISAWRYLTDALAAVRLSLPAWRRDGGPLFLLISREGTRDQVEIVQEQPESTADLAIVVNLGRLFARVGGANNGPSGK
jgi:DNA-binding transcriptional MerR regulator